MSKQRSILHANQRYHQRVLNLLSQLKGCSEELLNRRPADGGWTALQTAWHVWMAEDLALAYVRKKIHYGGPFERTGLSSAWRCMLIKLALKLPFRFKAPQATATENLPHPSTFENLETKWLKTRADWTAFFENLPDELTDRAIFKHPSAGRIGWRHMLDFLSVHLNRHDAQIRRALS